MYLFLILYSLFQLISASVESCQLLLIQLSIQAYTGEFNELLKESYPYLKYTGKGNVDFGLYESCIRNNYLYSSLIINQPKMRYQFGLCHSKNCTTNDLNQQETQDTIKFILNQSGIADQLNLSLSDFEMEAIDPQQSLYPINQGFIITLLLIGVLLLISLILPVAKLLFNFKTRKQRYLLLYPNNNIQTEISEQDIESFRLKDSISVRLLKDFSVVENFKQLTKFTVQDPNLTIFDGIRSVAFMMVLLGHQFSALAIASNSQELSLQITSWVFVNLVDLYYSVDMFFWVGGFFIGFVLFDQKKIKQIKQNPFSIFLIILHRILRIWPCYLFAILIHIYVAPHIGSGPRWYQTRGQFECHTPWRNIFFIDNWFNDDNYCFPWGWYLSNDIQMFIASLFPLSIYALVNKTVGKGLVVLLLLGTQLTGTLISYHFGFLIPGFTLSDPNQLFKYYDKPYCRAPPYYLGLLIGILYRESKQYENKQLQQQHLPLFYSISQWIKTGKQINRIVIQLICYLFGFGIMITLWVCWRKPQRTEQYMLWPQDFQTFYFSFCRLIFTFGLTLISIPNIVGISDKFNQSIMSNRLFKLMAKISFTSYLLHYIVVVVTISAFSQSPTFTVKCAFDYYYSNLAITLIVAFLMTLFIEMPFGKLEQRLMNYLAGGKQKMVNAPDLSSQLLKK